MPRRSGHVPAYPLHKPSGQARVIINREHIYLGRYGSPESKEKYARLIAGLASNPNGNGQQHSGAELSVSELIRAYWEFAKTYYVTDGEPSAELSCMRDAVRPLRRLYGRTKASEFGPKALKNLRQHLINWGLCRGLINQRITRVKRVFKWAVAEELIPPSVYHGLQAVSGLRYGRSQAKESEPIKPVTDEYVETVLPYVAPQVAAMVQVQRFTGMRPGEVVVMRACDIDMSGKVWFYEPHKHKNQWRGHRKIVPVGPKAQQVLKPFLDRDPDAYLFSPKEAEAWRLARRPAYYKYKRKTPIYPSELKARAQAKHARRNRKSKRPKRDHYDTRSYGRAVAYGFIKARKSGVEIPHWHPNQLRHSRGTEKEGKEAGREGGRQAGASLYVRQAHVRQAPLSGVANVAVDLRRYVGLCEEGQLYRYVQTHLPRELDYDTLKQRVRASLYDRDHHRNAVYRVLEKHFPSLVEFARRVKREDYRRLAHVAQQAESRFMFGQVVPRLMSERPGLFVATIHDSVLVPCGAEEYVRKVMLNELQPGDHLIVHSLKQIDSRIANVADAVERLAQQGVHLHVVLSGRGAVPCLSPDDARVLVAIRRWLLEERARCHGEAIRHALRWRREAGLPASGSPEFGRRRITHDGHKFDVWDLTECDRIREIAHRHAQGETIMSIAQSFYSRRLLTASGRRWVRRYGVKRRLNANRVYRALKFYKRLRAEGKRLERAGVDNPTISAPMRGVIAEYLLDDYKWFVFDVVDLGKEPVTNDAIQYRFASDCVYYPLRITYREQAIRRGRDIHRT